ncbi:MAG: hypothetical protein QM619_17125 [Micropruina sp.]|uniref:hypothetical protein n=1 Tax=Micropruina sp. TaxID=2737536 RepID=UPI0039E4EDCD
MPVASSVDRLRRSLLCAAPALLLGACTAVPSEGLGDLTRTLTERLSAEDEAGFLACFAPAAGAQALGRRMFATLSQTSTAIAPAGSGRLRVSWSLTGEPRVDSEAAVGLLGGRIVNLTATTTGTEWLGSPPGMHSAPELVVAAGTARHLSRWSRAAESALAALRRVAPSGRQWAEPVVVLVPDNLTGFAAYAGRHADRLGAVTVVPGLASSEGVRIVVNPDTSQKAADDCILLTHESVHAWMRSPRLTGTPGWLVEGIAEAFTADAHRQVASTNRELARTAIKAGLPRALPDIGDLSPATYALAQLAVQAMVAHLGWPAVLDEADARTHGGGRIADATVLGWYRDALADLD